MWHRHIESALNRIEGKVNKLATAEQWQALAGEINAATNEIADDIDRLIGRLGEVPEGVMAETTSIVARLKAVAAAYTPSESPTPGAAPGETPIPE